MIAQAVASPEAKWLRDVLEASHAGSWRDRPVRRWWGWRRAGLLPAREGFDHDHMPAAARTRWPSIRWIFERVVLGRWRYREQLSGECDVGFVRSTGEQAIVADAMEALGQDMEQEAADELVRRQRHGLDPAIA